jgi:hypothetical protein
LVFIEEFVGGLGNALSLLLKKALRSVYHCPVSARAIKVATDSSERDKRTLSG